MADVACLTPESDYSGFLATGVDEAVKRSALKKLFTDPHFNVMDGLDIYVGDYSRPDPMPPGMLAALNHAQALLNPLEQFESALPVAAQPATAVSRAESRPLRAIAARSSASTPRKTLRPSSPVSPSW